MKINDVVTEARSHPAQNRKFASGREELRRWFLDNRLNSREWGLSMTTLPKLGINPQQGISEDTPKGIYFYPLWYIWTWVNGDEKLPWGDNFPYMQVFQYDTSHQMTQQTQVNPAQLKQALSQYCSEEVIEQTEYNNDPYWYIYNCLISTGEGDETTIIRWNKVLRDLGFTSVMDEGKGWIAHNEPTQGVILDPRIIKQVKTFENYNRQINETWGIEKYPIPLPIGDYLGPESDEFAPPGNYSDVGKLHEEVWDLMDDGVEPKVTTVDPKRLYATQDWLSNEGGGEPLFPEFQDKPVIYKKDGRAYILDGHHRTTKAWKAGKPISVYLFSDEQELDEDAEESPGTTEQFNGIDIYFEDYDDGEIFVQALANGKELGYVLFAEENDYLVPEDLQVDEKYQRQGIASTMYDYVKRKGYKIKRSPDQTDAGAAFWDKHRPDEKVWENFADGKHPEDKGDSKRYGVPTKASVSTLRKVAKQGGRKGQLAHWMANMKAGKAKKK